MHHTSDEDWYKAFVPSGTTFIGTVKINVTVTNIPAGSNYDLHVDCNICTVTSEASTNAGNASETLFVQFADPTISQTIAASVTVQVRNVGDTASATPYTLTISPTAAP
jgi:hypothetical protein